MTNAGGSIFPVLYHAHHSLHAEDLPFWLDLAACQPGPILELGCGTGRVLLALARYGYRVYGLDKDLAMLAFLLRNTPPDLAAQALVIQADFTNFHLAQHFGLILLTCNTFSTLNGDARRAVLECVYRHLRPGGLFAVSMPNPRLLWELPARAEPEVEEVFPYPLDGEPVQVSSAWHRTKQHLVVDWHYDYLQSDGHVQRLSARVKHFLVPDETYLREVRQAGFASLSTFGDFDRSAYTNEAASLIILAYK
jgi:SAM-dependent methyltransferase